MTNKDYKRVQKQRELFKQINGFSYQAMVKWINNNSALKWGKMDNIAKYFWKSRYMEANGYGNN